MPVLTRWLAALAKTIHEQGPIAATHHRVVHPRGLPLNGDGFVRHQAVGPVQRPGQPPEYLSLMSFFVPSGPENAIQHGVLARELGALITFTLNRRIDVLAELSLTMEGQPGVATFLPLNGVPDRALLAPMEVDQPRLNELLRDYLGLLAGLPEKDADVIAVALDLHYGACLLFDRDLASAYTLLVAGVEAMSRRFGQPPRDWSVWDQADQWDRFSEENNLTEAQVDALRTRLMRDRQLRLNETFASYGSSTLPDSVWNSEWRDWTYSIAMPEGAFAGGSWQPGVPVEQLIPRDRDQLKTALRRSYNARSGFVHTGDRTGDVTAELFLTKEAPTQGQRLSFPGLRLLLRALIDHEVRARTTGNGVIPDVVMTLDAPETDRTKSVARWSTPKSGAREKKGGRRRRS